MQLFQVEYCEMYPTIHFHYSLFFVFSRIYKWLVGYSNAYHEKGLHNYSDWLHFLWPRYETN